MVWLHLLEQKSVKVGTHEIIIHELLSEDESRIRAACQIWNSKTKTWEIDRALLDASYIANSVDPKTWPIEWGLPTAELIRKLPAKLTRRLLVECNRLNTLSEDTADFLGQQLPIQEQPLKEQTASSTL
jgi:hypothetical protein